MADEIVQIGVEHRLADAERDHRRAELGELVDAAAHDVACDWRRDLVVLVAVSAVDVAATNGYDLYEQRMRRVAQAAHDLADRARLAADNRQNTHEISKL